MVLPIKPRVCELLPKMIDCTIAGRWRRRCMQGGENLGEKFGQSLNQLFFGGEIVMKRGNVDACPLGNGPCAQSLKPIGGNLIERWPATGSCGDPLAAWSTVSASERRM